MDQIKYQSLSEKIKYFLKERPVDQCGLKSQ